MQRVVLIGFAVFLIVHGLIHLMGTTVYMRLGQVQGIPYKTTLLGGRWELGGPGMRLFGALWILPTVGFIVGGVFLIASQPAWVPLIVFTAAVSLVLTVLDWQVAYAGAIVDVAVLTVILLYWASRASTGA